ncbi:putative Mg2+ transporter-C (MgtC) family protein [Paenibacillus sp. UNCCL117]|nr:putative Mg2+ transporter-C (MgtC) family protein [Paenibacillus sp. cl123]SFW66154.1 putative Mg2+ transporter-C (MgtC) family protein [Paenibacillus sp. UNCCL117]
MVDSVWHINDWDLTIRLLMSAGLGGLIGLEREWNHHAAGFRTHILVCLGSTAIMLLSIYGFEAFVNEPNVRTDPARLAAQVISGIGFLGAGAILRTGSTVSGLTTAASIWVVAAIGLSIGAGFYYPALLTTVLVLISLFALNKWEKLLMRNRRSNELVVKVLDYPGMLGRIASELGEQGLQIKNIQMKTLEEDGAEAAAAPVMELKLHIRPHHPGIMAAALEKIAALPHVLEIQSSGQVQSMPAQRQALKM